MIRTMPIPVGTSDLPKVRVKSLDPLARRRDREDKVRIYHLHKRWGHLIVVIDGVGQVHTRRSDVAHRESHAPGELALDIHIPLRFVRSMGIEFNVRGLDGAKSEQT